MMVFSNSTCTLNAFAGAIASSLFGDALALEASSIQVLDFAQLVPTKLLESTNHDVKSMLRSAMSASLGSCPDRSLFIMENVQVLDDATLPVLDTFLDPMNGIRAHFQQHHADGVTTLLDCTNAVFLFLYHVERAFDSTRDAQVVHPEAATWREFLMAKWTRKVGLAEEFTPQAFVGRLTEGVTLFASKEKQDASRSRLNSRPWRQMCLPHKVDTSRGGGWEDQDDYAGTFMRRPEVLAWTFAGLIPAFLLLYWTKIYTQGVAYKRAQHSAESNSVKAPVQQGKDAHDGEKEPSADRVATVSTQRGKTDESARTAKIVGEAREHARYAQNGEVAEVVEVVATIRVVRTVTGSGNVVNTETEAIRETHASHETHENEANSNDKQSGSLGTGKTGKNPKTASRKSSAKSKSKGGTRMQLRSKKNSMH